MAVEVDIIVGAEGTEGTEVLNVFRVSLGD